MSFEHDDALVYLRPDVKAEPLINGWYAWSFLVSPVTFALVARNLHLRMLDSYLKSPKLHAQAVRNQALKGGMFVDFGGDPATMHTFVKQSRTALADLLVLADGLTSFDAQLQESADGDSLIGWYPRLPEPLRGRCELVYDRHCRPRLRFIEPLLYASPLYKPELQGFRLSPLEGDGRPFVMSSPRLEDTSSVWLQGAFAAPFWDSLFAMRHTPVSRSAFRRLVGWDRLDSGARRRLDGFVSAQAPRRAADSDVAPGAVRIRYFGHATVLMQTATTSVLTDPIVSYAQPGGIARFDIDDLPERIDYVLLTHNHQDHVMLETLLQLRHLIGCVVVPRGSNGALIDPSLRHMLQAIGFGNVIELGELDRLALPDGEVLGVPFLGEHGDLDVPSKLAYRVRLGGRACLFAADSNNLEPTLYRHLRPHIGALDQLFIGMECAGAPLSWLYGPLLGKPIERKHDQARRLNGSDAERAWAIVDALQPAEVNVYAMGAEPWLTFISSIEYTSESEAIVESDALIARCRAHGIPAARLFCHHESLLAVRADVLTEVA